MKVFKDLSKNNLNESLEKRVNRLVESYNKSDSLQQFLMENGNNEENEILYHFMALNESQDENNRFTFENEMYIPGLGSKATGRLSLNNIANESKNIKEFVNNVSKMICEEKLMFEPTNNDLLNLTESFIEYKKQQML